jgi:hypothetical protein
MGFGMSEQSRPEDIVFRIVGKPELRNRVLASVFARKLGILIRAMTAADKSANGGKRFDYVIVDMKASSAAATIHEQQVSRLPALEASSVAFGKCLSAVNSGNVAVARRSLECAVLLRALATDVEDTFSHAEVTVNGAPTVVVDRFFLERVTEVVASAKEEKKAEQWFKGSTVGTFDGQILETDLRGSVPQVILRLTAGGKDIHCVCPALTVDEIKTVLNQRVRVSGNAYYDGKSGLPIRIEITSMPHLIKVDADFRRWKGSFSPFEPDSWVGEN